jgi:multiple sugar transport system substrate-binding protein
MMKTPLKLCCVLTALALLAISCGKGTDNPTPPTGPSLVWHDDGSVDLITFEDKEKITLTKEQLGTEFGPGKKPYAGQTIAISVLGQGAKGGISGPLYRLKPAWEELSGAKLKIVEVPMAEQLSLAITDLEAGGQLDGTIQGAWYMGEFITGGYLTPVDELMKDPRFPKWDPKWMPTSLSELHKWDDKWYGVLNDSDGQVLYWRNDILADPEWQKKYKAETGSDMPFPAKTWDDVTAIAKFFHGKNWDGNDDQPDSGIVMHFKVKAQGHFHFMSLSAPFVVMPGDTVDRGTNNYWFDPETMEPLIDQPGHLRALETLYELQKYGPEAQAAWDLGEAWDHFLTGKSIFVFSWGDVGTLVQDPSRSKVQGKLGASVLPGAKQVYDMNANEWVTLDTPNVVGNTTGGTWHGVIFSTSKHPEAVYSFYALMATEPVSVWSCNRGWTGVDPGADIHFLEPRGSAKLPGYLAAGWNESDLKFYLDAYYGNFYAKTMLPYLRIDGAEEYWRALDRHLNSCMIGQVTAKEALAKTKAEWQAITKRRGLDEQRKQYQRSIGYKK